MLYSTLLVATAAFAGFVAAQNSTSQYTLPPGVSPCCNVNPDTPPKSEKQSWCTAQENTCPEICGGQGQIASGGNECDENTLKYTCKCRNGTEPNMNEYQQSVPGQMCRFWFGQCTNATINAANGEGSSAYQFACDSIQREQCGNKTTKDASETGSTTSGSSRPTHSSSSGSGSGSSNSESQTSSGAAEATNSPGAAVRLAQDFGAPVLAGGMIALFGIAL